MEALGTVFLILIAATVIVAVILLVMALPDLSRYRRLRRM